MADVMPDYFVEQQRVRAQIASLKHSLERQKLEIMEIDHRRAKTVENMASTEDAIKSRQKDLTALEKEHGKAPAPQLG